LYRRAHARGGPVRDLPVHRNVVQPEAAAFDARLHQPSGVGTAVAGGRVVPITHASAKSGQAHRPICAFVRDTSYSARLRVSADDLLFPRGAKRTYQGRF
jgi:hypothetical protein